MMTDAKLSPLAVGRTYAETLRAVAAEAWDEGYHAARVSVEYAHQPDEPSEFDNPYRQA